MWTTLKFRAATNGVMHKMHRVTQLQFKGFDTKAVGSARRAKIALDLMGIKSAGPVPMPRKRTLYAFLKSPFKWKKHQELWETRIYTRILTFEADVLTTRKALKFIAKTKYDGVGLRVKRLSFEPLEKYYKDPYIHTAEIDRKERLEALRKSAAAKISWAGRNFLSPTSNATLVSLDVDGKVTSQPLTGKGAVQSFEEEGVLDEDIVYDDTDFRFKVPKKAFQTLDEMMKQQLQQLIEDVRTGKLFATSASTPKVEEL